MNQNREYPFVSVIITTKNAQIFIKDCLEAISKQDYPKDRYETIVIDNHSSDKTKEFALQYDISFYEVGPERSTQRNYGADVCKGEYILFVDVDECFESISISKCIETIKSNKDVVACSTSERIVGDNFFNRVRNFETSFYDNTVINPARFIKKDIFMKVGGFDTTLSGPEDWDLTRALSQYGKCINADTKRYHNEGTFHLINYVMKKSYYSTSFSKYINKWGNDKIIKKQFGLFYRYFWIFIEKGKWIKALRSPHYLLGFYFIKFFIGLVFLSSKFKITKKASPYQ